MYGTKQNWVFYYKKIDGKKVVTHTGSYIRPKSTKHWKELENMPEDVTTIGLELSNN